MFHLTIFGGTDSEIAPSGFTAVTFFGAAELRRPTLARRIVHERRIGERKPSRWARLFGTDRNLILTVFGATEIKKATLMEEYQALRSLVQTGAVSADECPQLLQRVALQDDHELYTSMTFFGASSVEATSPKEERKALDAAIKSGLISDRERAALENAIGSSDPAVARVLGDLIALPV